MVWITMRFGDVWGGREHEEGVKRGRERGKRGM